jgi:hypothetical protein
MVLAVASTWSLACLRFPNEQAYIALDYQLDRPRVAAIRVSPPVLAHGLPVTIDALILGPGEPSDEHVAICGLRTDLPTYVGEEQCFRQPELVDDIGDGLPIGWEPPDLATVTCPEDTGNTPDTGWTWGICASVVPLLVSAKVADEPVFGRVDAWLRVRGYNDGEPVPPSFADLPHSLTVSGEPRAGGEVELTASIDGDVDEYGFRWWVDAGELVGTGRTAVHELDGDSRVTHNTLRIPDDFHGSLRVAVVEQSLRGETDALVGDQSWDVITLEVP